MAEENQVMKEPQQITKEPQSEAAQVQQITTKNPKKVEAGKRLAESNHKKREVKKQSKPILWNWGCYSSGGYRWSWLLHLSNQESRATTTK